MADNIIPLPPKRARAKSKASAMRMTGEQDAAQRFIELHGENVHFVPDWKRWLVWDGSRWKPDHRLAINGLGKATSNQLWDEAKAQNSVELASLARRIRSANGLRGVLFMAANDVAIDPATLDTDLWLLNTPTGTIDLKTGQVFAARRRDLITKSTAVGFDPAAECPRWQRFLEEVFIRADFAPDFDMVSYIQRLAGYILTGSVQEQIFAILHGNGNNGKGVFTNTLLRLMGDYAGVVPSSLLLTKRTEPHPTGQAKLAGLRLAISAETAAGHRLDEELIKTITGIEMITARRMHEDFWDFTPTHKLLLATNHMPEIRGTDEGIRRRLHLVPFNRKFAKEERVLNLEEQLVPELPGILNWAIAGCLFWQDRGLDPPTAVVEATRDFLVESDSVGRFLEDCCDTDNRAAFVRAGTITGAYQTWCTGEGEEPLSGTLFGRELTARGFPLLQQWEDGANQKMRQHIWLKDGGLA